MNIFFIEGVYSTTTVSGPESARLTFPRTASDIRKQIGPAAGSLKTIAALPEMPPATPGVESDSAIVAKAIAERAAQTSVASTERTLALSPAPPFDVVPAVGEGVPVEPALIGSGQGYELPPVLELDLLENVDARHRHLHVLSVKQ
jgi:hypothetical protein